MRFKNWRKPKFNKQGVTKWQWMCQGLEGLVLGKNTDIGAFTYINAKYGVEIMEDVQIGSHCAIYSESTIDNIKGKVKICRGARIGSHSTIMPNVTVGENAVIGAYSFVKKNVPSNSFSFGIPAKIVKQSKLKNDQENGSSFKTSH